MRQNTETKTILSSSAPQFQRTCVSDWNSAITFAQRESPQSWFLLPGCKFLARVHGNQNHCSGISSNDVPGAAMEFRVIWEIDIDAKGPKEAAQQARAIQLTPGMSATVFDVWECIAGKMHRIDLVEEADRLDHDELFAVRAGLRLLQGRPDTPPSIQDLATVILIFLDRDNMISKRVYRGPSR
jgi:hypothetical protein